MELIDQRTKLIMEGCKERARDSGLVFADQSLEYIVTNRDLIELTPKLMIPTLYDYWVQDVEVFKEKGRYELYPGNPYETVINTRPAISFYNDNNPDWLNVMIFYHVLAHIDFFQKNYFFRHTWDYDFTAKALSDKRLISGLRSQKGRWVDYVIEFTRGIDNLVGYYIELSNATKLPLCIESKLLNYYFDIFLQNEKKVSINEYIKEVERYNQCVKDFKEYAEKNYFAEVHKKYPEFEAISREYLGLNHAPVVDLIQYIMENSVFIKKDGNAWMKSIMGIIRQTSIFFQPQIRTKIMNEGWASYWHEKLFLNDDRINGHEIDFARINAGITAMPGVGLNPYALGMKLFSYIEKLVDKGKYSIDFRKITDSETRKNYDKKTDKGLDFIFKIRETYNDFATINTFVTQDFVAENNLFVTGKRLNKDRMVWEYYIKSRNVDDYKEMLFNTLYHPPFIEVKEEKNENNTLYLYHNFEEKPLVKEYISNTMLGIEYLWGGPVQLETSEVDSVVDPSPDSVKGSSRTRSKEREIKWKRVLYTMKERKLTKKIL
jgi:stage V sporulation protein R